MKALRKLRIKLCRHNYIPIEKGYPNHGLIEWCTKCKSYGRGIYDDPIYDHNFQLIYVKELDRWVGYINGKEIK